MFQQVLVAVCCLLVFAVCSLLVVACCLLVAVLLFLVCWELSAVLFGVLCVWPLVAVRCLLCVVS